MSKAKEYYDKTKHQDSWGIDVVYPNEVEAIIELANLEGVLQGLKICKEMWAQGRINHENIYENEVYYKELLENKMKELAEKPLEISETITVYKHHVAQYFIEGHAPTHPNGGGQGATVFLSFDSMCNYITDNAHGKNKKELSYYYFCELEVKKSDLIFNFKGFESEMATLSKDVESELGFMPIVGHLK